MPIAVPSHSDPSFLALQTALAGRFSLERELGRGGMGIVYLARDVILERPVAIKLLNPSLSRRDEMRRRFLREARLAAQCFHPHIVPIHEVAEAGDLAWFVMSYVQGETLAERLHRVGTLHADDVRRIGREIGWALAYAHERGVVHRDVKPENILLEQGSDRALIADFGIALTTASATVSTPADGVQTSADDVAGTMRYMAPEQAMGGRVDGRADLYALGVTLFFAASGRYPHRGLNAVALMARQQQQVDTSSPDDSLRRHAPRLPVSLADAIDQCLALRPDDRFDDAAAFVAALERTQDGGELPVGARAVRAGIVGTMSLADWTIAIAYAGFLLVLGEEARTFGRGIMVATVQAVLTFASISMAVRGGETLLAMRRALRAGVSPDDVATALAPPPAPPVTEVGPIKGALMLTAASVLGYAQGSIDEQALPAVIELAGNVLTWLAPPILIHRALTGMRHESGFSSWLYAFVRKPLAERVVGWFGGRARNTSARVAPANAPTEVLLDRAAHDIFARLPQSLQESLRELPVAAAGLARSAALLRVQVQELHEAQRALRMGGAPNEDTLAVLHRDHAAAQARLGATVAALENIRLELLRLEAGQSIPGSLTEQLEVVRDLQRRVDANDAVRHLLSRGEITPA